MSAGLMGTVEKNAASTVEDIFQFSGEFIKESMYDVNRENFSGYMWVACLDWKTCLVCGDLDGKIFIIGHDMELFHDEYSAAGGEGVINEPAPQIPRHARCRCSMVPVLKGMEQDYQSVTYNDWLGRQPENIQMDILGPSRFALFKKGDPIERFIKDGRIATLDELRALRTTRKEILQSRTSGVKIDYTEKSNEDDNVRKLLAEMMKELGIDVDLNKSSKETIEYLPDLHARVLDDFPEIKQALQRINAAIIKDIDIGAEYVTPEYPRNYHHINYQQIIFNNTENLLKYIKSGGDGWFASQELSGPIAHEYGHAILELISRSIADDKLTEKLVKDMAHQTLKNNNIKSWLGVKKGLSKYAAVDMSYNELIAETVSDYLSSILYGKEPRQISKDMYNNLKGLYRSYIR